MKAFVFIALVTILVASFVVRPAWPQDPALIEQGQRTFMKQGCYGCHTVGKTGTPIGPDLSHVGAKYRSDYIARWLRDPSYLRPSAHMPTLELSDEDIRSLAAFLATRQ